MHSLDTCGAATGQVRVNRFEHRVKHFKLEKFAKWKQIENKNGKLYFKYNFAGFHVQNLKVAIKN